MNLNKNKHYVQLKNERKTNFKLIWFGWLYHYFYYYYYNDFLYEIATRTLTKNKNQGLILYLVSNMKKIKTKWRDFFQYFGIEHFEL